MPATSVRPLCPELATIARLELNETPKKLEDGIQHLKEWINKQPHLRARTDDQWLAAFLRGCKHSLEKAKEKLDLYYTMRSIAPELYESNSWDPKFVEVLKTGIGLAIPKRLKPADPRVIVVRALPYDPDRFQPPDFFAVAQTVLQIILMEDDPCVIAGTVVVCDMHGLTMDYFAHLTAANLKKAIMFFQDASPHRVVAIHFIGMPSIFQVVFNMAKQFLNEKNKQKLLVHKGGYKDLHKYISTDILPEEYGGYGGTFQEITDCWVRKVAEYATYFKEDLQYGTDENRRPGKPRTAESLVGADGSFRQLGFD